MIVRSVRHGWRVVFHSAHALLAQSLAAELAVEEDLPFWWQTQVAIGIHDDGKEPFLPDKHVYLSDAGAPLDFTLSTMEAKDRVTDARTQIWEAVKKHRWIGLLVSLHNHVLYEHEPASNEMRLLLDEESERRARVLAQLNVTAEQLRRSYDWMHWCDRCSLILSGNDIPAMQRHVEIVTNSQGVRYDLHADREGTLHVEPWPFRRRQIELALETRELRQLAFPDDAQLAKALRDATVEEVKFRFEELGAESQRR